MSSCVVCGWLCTPMADYAATVCLHCDERMATILAVGPLPPRTVIGGDLFERLRAQMAAA
jgi:hypothetical protein